MSLSDLLSTKIILASKSPRRKQLLEQMGFEVVVDSVDIEETFPPNLDVEDVAEYLAIKKSKNYKKDVAEKSILVTSDTVVVVDNIILGKPKNVQEAKEFLRLLSSKTHKVITGCCLKTHNNKIKYFSEQTVVKFKELTEEEIDFYVNKYKPFDKAGAYGIQEWIGFIGVRNISGSYFNVVGLPIQRLYTELKKI